MAFQGQAVYVRYEDHVLYKNLEQPIADAVDRETVGWLTKETDEIMLIEHDRTIPCLQIPTGQGNGIIILKNCIIEMYKLLLQEPSEGHLNSQESISKNEYALRARAPKKRKTQLKTSIRRQK